MRNLMKITCNYIIIALLALASLFWFLTAPEDPLKWELGNHHSNDYHKRYFDK